MATAFTGPLARTAALPPPVATCTEPEERDPSVTSPALAAAVASVE